MFVVRHSLLRSSIAITVAPHTRLAAQSSAAVRYSHRLHALPLATRVTSRAIDFSCFHSARTMSSTSSSSIADEFQKRVTLGKSLPPLSDNAAKLEMYALFKQANVGKNTTSKPGMLDFVGKAKWEAWSKLGDLSQADAMTQYIAIIDNLAAKHGVSADGTASTTMPPPAPLNASDDLKVSISDAGLLTIALNRPTKYNALNRGMYDGIIDALATAATQPHVKAVVLRANGAMFSSGNDLSMFTDNPDNVSFDAMADAGALLLERFVDAFITFPKPLVAAVQGPAVGIAVTLLALCDLVYVSESTTLQTPFTALGQSPEACSSVLFPRIMGTAQANAMLLLGEKLGATEAVATGLATAAFNTSDFDVEVDKKLAMLLSRYPIAMQHSKALIRSSDVVDELKRVNRRECATLKQMWLGSECMDAILKFQSRKKEA